MENTTPWFKWRRSGQVTSSDNLSERRPGVAVLALSRFFQIEGPHHTLSRIME